MRINFRMSGSLMKLSRVVAHRNLVVASRSFAQIKAGDLGLLAEQSRASQRAPLHQTPYFSFRQQLFLCFFSVFFFKPNDSIPYCAYIWACSRGIPLIFGVVLPNFVYFYCFGGWKTNQCRKKNIVFVAFLWSVSL